MNEGKQAVNRLKKILMADKMQSYEGFFRVLKGDLCALLNCYMTFDSDTLKISFDVDNDGNYLLDMKVIATNIKSPKTLD